MSRRSWVAQVLFLIVKHVEAMKYGEILKVDCELLFHVIRVIYQKEQK